MNFLKYPKIYRVGGEETLGILDKPVYVQEKLDGANASIWLGDDGTLRCGSRNQEVTNQGFRGLPEFLKSDAAQGIYRLLLEKPHLRLYGEWLVKHTLEYKPECYQQFYLFDIYDNKIEKFWSPGAVQLGMIMFPGISMVDMTSDAGVYSLSELKRDFVGKSVLTAKPNNGEGIVVKSRCGNFSAKIVREEFKEENAAHFRAHRSEPFYWESWATHSFVTVPRVTKAVQSIYDATGVSVTIKDTARVISTVYSDILTEEVSTIAKKVQGGFNFKVFGKLAAERTKELFFGLIDN